MRDEPRHSSTHESGELCSKDTFRTTREVHIKGPMPSPLVLVCKDPGSVSISDLTVSISPYTWPNTTTLTTIATIFKVILKAEKAGKGWRKGEMKGGERVSLVVAEG